MFGMGGLPDIRHQRCDEPALLLESTEYWRQILDNLNLTKRLVPIAPADTPASARSSPSSTLQS